MYLDRPTEEGDVGLSPEALHVEVVHPARKSAQDGRHILLFVLHLHTSGYMPGHKIVVRRFTLLWVQRENALIENASELDFVYIVFELENDYVISNLQPNCSWFT